MENGDKARLEYAVREIEKLRVRMHDRATYVGKVGLEIDNLKTVVAEIKRTAGQTTSVLDRWKDWALGALFAALVFMVFHFGLPRVP